ncbi:MAG: SDR family NAD(P)-dependent oxidoreductase [Neisseriales bacterium]|nr:MAG: SDR family NAD(P)-dependent oxidoreductase [Neisseriales bacterium]
MIVLVTGATSGFGEAIAKRFVKEGHFVIATGRRQNRLNDLQSLLGKPCYTLNFDVADRIATENALSSLPDRFSKIDVLINNAGLAIGTETFADCVLDEWEVMVNTNIKGLLYCTYLVLQGMLKRSNGHIINLGSVAGEWPYRGGNVYGASKAFVHQLSNNLRIDLLGTPIRVTNIEPGFSGNTEFSIVRFRGDKTKAKALYDKTQPLTAEDIAEAVYWVCALPKHVNINVLQMMPICQTYAGLTVHQASK